MMAAGETARSRRMATRDVASHGRTSSMGEDIELQTATPISHKQPIQTPHLIHIINTSTGSGRIPVPSAEDRAQRPQGSAAGEPTGYENIQIVKCLVAPDGTYL